jgi:hypothetical protein
LQVSQWLVSCQYFWDFERIQGKSPENVVLPLKLHIPLNLPAEAASVIASHDDIIKLVAMSRESDLQTREA